MVADMEIMHTTKEASEEYRKIKAGQKERIPAKDRNEMEIVFDAISCNESFARVAVAAFIAHLNPTLEEISDLKTAVSEAVTNAIIHGYEEKEGTVVMQCCLSGSTVHITVKDSGKGIADIERAKEPFFTTRPELERSGMGFSFMEAFMDEVEVWSKVGEGTVIKMKKNLVRES